MTDAIIGFRGEYFWLSNFYHCEFDVPGLGRVRSAEHAYQALKSDDPEVRAAVLQAERPGDAKRVGRELPLPDDWEVGGRVAVMQTVLTAKFQNPELADRLYETGTARLVEGNEHHDNFWGDCECGAPACTERGTNMLGELLMMLRSTLEDVDELEAGASQSSTWDEMRDWLVESLDDQPVGLEIGLGPKDIRVHLETEMVDLADFDDQSDGVPLEESPEAVHTEAVCVQIYVLDAGTYLVRRSRKALRTIRFLDHDAKEAPKDTWLHDDPFHDCTGGYLYTTDRRLAADAAVSWFRDNGSSPALADLGCEYEFAEHLPMGEGAGTYNDWR